MFTWAQIILKVLSLLEWLIEQGQQHKWINEGERRQIAKSTAKVLEKQEFARETLKEVTALSDDKLDALLRTLEGHPEPGSSQR